jgi:hypothetical protein
MVKIVYLFNNTICLWFLYEILCTKELKKAIITLDPKKSLEKREIFYYKEYFKNHLCIVFQY